MTSSPTKAKFRAVASQSFRSRGSGFLLVGRPGPRSISARPRSKRGRLDLSPFQLAEANQRWLWLKAAQPLLAAGLSQAATAAAIGVSAPTFSRLLNRAPMSHVERKSVFNAHEKCRRLLAAGREHLAPEVAPGRVSAFDTLLKDGDVKQELKQLYVETICESGEPTSGRRPGSIAAALKRLGDFPLVPPRLATKLQAGCKPKSLVEFLKHKYPRAVAAKLGRYTQRIAGGKIAIQVHSARPPEIWQENRRLS